VRDATRGGLFLRADPPFPPARSRVHIALPGQDGAVEVQGEVVRHVTPPDAARWGMAPGFAVELAPLSAAQRAAVDALGARLAVAPAAAPGRPAGAAAAPSLEELERRAALGFYEALGAPQDAGFPEIRERARAVRRWIDALRDSLAPEALASRVPALLARVEAAATQLGTPAERLMFDARRGNFHGVAHCVTAGMPSAVVAALTEDPLDLELHEAYWAMKRSGE
jgi:serine/threonine-protein kinase